MYRSLLALFIALSSSMVFAETISYSIYSLPIFRGEPRLVAEGKRVYSHDEIRSTPGPVAGITNWSRTLAIANGVEIGASVYRESKTDGFGLWIHKDGQGFSWEWFTRESDQVFRKLQGPGRLKVRFARIGQLEELAEIEFLDDVTLRVNTLWFTTFIPFLNQESDHLVVRKGSVLWLAP